MRARLGSGARLLGVDVARSLALIGMMSVHIFAAFRPDGSLHPAYVVAAGRSAALFAVLAGVGLALATGGQQPLVGRHVRAARAPILSALVRDHLTPIGERGGHVVLKELFLTGTYPAFTWTTYLFVGLAICRSDLRRRGLAVALLVGARRWRRPAV